MNIYHQSEINKSNYYRSDEISEKLDGELVNVLGFKPYSEKF